MVSIVWDLTTDNREMLHVYNVQLNVWWSWSKSYKDRIDWIDACDDILHSMCMCGLCLREFSFIPTAADVASHAKKALCKIELWNLVNPDNL